MRLMATAADQIDRFLRDNPAGCLYVVVGFASPFGLRWLAERSDGREVRLLIGDIRTGFSRPAESDRVAAIRFITRGDVRVVNWYRKRGGHRTAHAKAWMIKPAPGADTASEFLVGSANLTRKGLFQNVEMMTRPHPDEHDRLHTDMLTIMNKAWPIESKLLQKLKATNAASRPSAVGNRDGLSTAHAPAHNTPTPRRSNTGTRSADQESPTQHQHREHAFRDRSTKRELVRKLLVSCAVLTTGSSLLFGAYLLVKTIFTTWLGMVGL